LIVYLGQLLYSSYIVPHLQGWVDDGIKITDKRKKEAYDKHHKELVEMMSALAQSDPDPLSAFEEKAKTRRSVIEEDPNEDVEDNSQEKIAEEDGEKKKKKKNKKKVTKDGDKKVKTQ
jgi:hypothetical protein